MPRIPSRNARPPGPFFRFFFGRIIPLIAIGVGGFALVSGLRDVIRAKAAESWPTAPAVVVASSIQSHKAGDGAEDYTAKIAYRFRVKDTEYLATRITFADTALNEAEARETVARYPEGKAVTTHYSPEDPAFAVLEPGTQPAIVRIPVFGGVFLLVGVAIAVFLPKAMRRQAELAEIEPTPENASYPTGYKLEDKHPKVSRTTAVDTTTFTTSGRNLIGWILVFVAVAQAALLFGVIFKGGLPAPAYFFLAADTLFLLVGAFILFGRFAVTVSSGRVGYKLGVAGVGFGKTIAVVRPMTVTLEYRGVKVNGRDVSTLVVRNGEGAEFSFGTLLDESRKQYLAGHLATLLKAEKNNARKADRP